MGSPDGPLLPALDAKHFHPLQRYINEAGKADLGDEIII